jgi:hypothetical protein
MPTYVSKVSLRGTVERRDLGEPLLQEPGDAVLVERGNPRLLVLRCPCGCGDDLLINLDRRAGAAWHLYRNRTALSLYPSYWRNDHCCSHFIVWNSHIYWCRGWGADDSEDWRVSSELEETVYSALATDCFIKFEQIAEQLGLVPWEVLQACRQLAKSGKAVADIWPRSGMYRRVVGV